MNLFGKAKKSPPTSYISPDEAIRRMDVQLDEMTKRLFSHFNISLRHISSTILCREAHLTRQMEALSREALNKNKMKDKNGMCLFCCSPKNGVFVLFFTPLQVLCLRSKRKR